MAESWFTWNSSNEEQSQQLQPSSSSLLADWNSYAASSRASEDGSSLGSALSFDIESSVRSANDAVNGTFNVSPNNGNFDVAIRGNKTSMAAVFRNYFGDIIHAKTWEFCPTVDVLGEDFDVKLTKEVFAQGYEHFILEGD